MHIDVMITLLSLRMVSRLRNTRVILYSVARCLYHVVNGVFDANGFFRVCLCKMNLGLPMFLW